MSKIKLNINSPFVAPWAERIGKIILNFSGIEFSSYTWLLNLTENSKLIEEFTRMKFSERVKRIKVLILERAFDESWKNEAIIYWETAMELAIKRNRIAHNPLMFGWTNNNEVDEPDFIGIINMKKNKEDLDEPLLKKNEIDQYINKIVEVASKLDILLGNWCSTRDKQIE